MCIIAVAKKRKPTIEEIKNMWQRNSDGGGLAYKKGSKLYFKKGIMSLDEMIKEIEKSTLPAVYHFRIRSTGAVNEKLTHPFEINFEKIRLEGYTNKLLFMNGTYRDYKDTLIRYLPDLMKLEGYKNDWLDDELNDTRAIAILLNLLPHQFLKLIDAKFVYWENNKIIRVYGSGWIEDNGIIFSNSTYKTYKVQSSYYANTKRTKAYKIDNKTGRLIEVYDDFLW